MTETKHFKIFFDPAMVAEAAADWLLPALAASQSGPFSLALSGGAAPQHFYRLLTEEPYRSQIPWHRLHVFLVDERHVPYDHVDSNFRMIKEVLLDHVPISADNVHPMPTDQTPERCAERYQAELVTFFGEQPPRFDAMVLGMGPDGHIASLFPGRSLETDAWVAPVFDSPKLPPTRLTLTLPLINQARRVMFVVTGGDKAEAIAKVFSQGSKSGLPAARVLPPDAETMWFMDNTAAASF